MDYSLTGGDIERALGKSNVDVILYPDLANIKSIRTYFQNKRYLVILYNWGGNYGHWTCLFRYPNGNVIEFFDPYGVQPDHELFEFSKKIRKKNGMDFPWLSKLLIDWDGEIEYNNYAFQKDRKGVSTCGRWVIYRCKKWNMTIDEFKTHMEKEEKTHNLKGDKLIVELTNPMILKTDEKEEVQEEVIQQNGDGEFMDYVILT